MQAASMAGNFSAKAAFRVLSRTTVFSVLDIRFSNGFRDLGKLRPRATALLLARVRLELE